MGLKTKICSQCKIEKTTDHFYKDKYTIDKLRCRCKECGKKYQQSENGKKSIKNIVIKIDSK